MLTGPNKRFPAGLTFKVQSHKQINVHTRIDEMTSFKQTVLLWTFILPPMMKSPIVADAAQSPSDWKDYV